MLLIEDFDQRVIGKATKGTICTYEYSGGIIVYHSKVLGAVATTLAHEMGHNFGFEHDNDDCKCIDKNCIMAPATLRSTFLKHWSTCSVEQLKYDFQRLNYCLRNKPKQMFEFSSCGNGIVEVGEQCDCGLPENCNNSCCDSNLCKLFSNATCGTGECCDLSTCRLRKSGYKCRTSTRECDLPEFCTGESEYCPNDIFLRNTELCGNGKAYCYEGSCQSRSAQCNLLWGSSEESPIQCYKRNIDGNPYGNCGHDKLSNIYKKCNVEDIFCGLLHCSDFKGNLQIGMNHSTGFRDLIYTDKRIRCRMTNIDLGLDIKDPGLTPDGAICGKNKMCLDTKCISLDTLRSSGIGVACEHNCSGNGLCNSNGNCYCKVGYAPPLCKTPGVGGSIDSGPASSLIGEFKI